MEITMTRWIVTKRYYDNGDRYANVNVDELQHNLENEDLVNKGLKLFIKDFIMSMPTGKQNSFANKTLPSYIMLEFRNDTPVNLASAFEQPIRSKSGYLEKAIEALQLENDKVQKLVEKPVKTVIINLNDPNSKSLTEAINEIVDQN